MNFFSKFSNDDRNGSKFIIIITILKVSLTMQK